jgi:hypothetical protein
LVPPLARCCCSLRGWRTRQGAHAAGGGPSAGSSAGCALY